MRSVVMGVLVAVGGIITWGNAPAFAQQTVAPAAKLQSQGSVPPAAAARELPTNTNTRTQLMGEAGSTGLAPTMAGNVGLVDTNAGTSSVEKGRTQ